MKVVFADHSPIVYDAATPFRAPLGGSQSAACYLARALSRRGHSVMLTTAARADAVIDGVDCRPSRALDEGLLRRFGADVLVVLNSAHASPSIRSMTLRAGCSLVLWTQHAADQPDVAPLRDPAVGAAFDRIAFVSDWQRRQYLGAFSLAGERTTVLRNAVAPAFEGLFEPEEDVAAAKSGPPTLAYTSTPFRGLELLVAVFPLIRRFVPEARLKVFSSMKVYQANEGDEAATFGELYDRCRATEGIEYVGSVPQPSLARELRAAKVFAYPSLFAETSCIAAMEAMAAGCQLVLSDLGALPETAAGFARLSPLHPPIEDFAVAFARQTARALLEPMDAARERLRRQVDVVLAEATWDRRAAEWERMLRTLRGA